MKRQDVDQPKAIQVQYAQDLVINGKVDLDALIMVIAGSVAGGP
jgi:hypothetical protein